MSANLSYDEKSGEMAIFTLGEAWHKQSQVVAEAQTSEQAIKLAHLDYEVVKVPVYANGKKIPNNWATLRKDNNQPLGVVGNKYTILQNKDAFKFVDELVGSKEAIFHSAGALGVGQRIFLTCKLPDKLVVGLNDVADNYFFLTNSHDGSRVVEVAFTNVFIVCENTLREALASAKRAQRIRHTKGVYNGLVNAAELMGITREKIADQKTLFDQMVKVTITDKELKKFIELAMNPAKEEIKEEEFSKRFENVVEEVLEYSLSDPAQLIEERKGTLWGAVNGISGFYNNVQTYKTGEKKLNSLMYGTAYQRSQHAIDLAYDVLFNSLKLS